MPVDCAKRYYDALSGEWHGRFRLRVVDADVLSRLSPLTRAIGTAAKLPAAVSMSTTLRAGSEPGSYEHTTRVTSLWAPVLTSQERIEIDPDGRSFEIAGWQRMLGRSRVPFRGKGEIDESGLRATYFIEWLGRPMVQRTAVVDGRLRLTQETDWSFGEVTLVRRST